MGFAALYPSHDELPRLRSGLFTSLREATQLWLERSGTDAATQSHMRNLDCFVATAPRNDGTGRYGVEDLRRFT
jgi:hypothetical protein